MVCEDERSETRGEERGKSEVVGEESSVED